MNKNEIILITGNESKVREYERLLGMQLGHQKLDLPEIQATDVREVAMQKATHAYQIVGKPCLVDDSGLTIHAWGELPGALIRWFIDNVGTTGILKMLTEDQSRAATVTTAIGYCDQNGPKVYVGQLKGTIAHEPAGDNGFGYDEIFIPNSYTTTVAQMSSTDKDAISMRSIAAKEFKSDNYIC